MSLENYQKAADLLASKEADLAKAAATIQEAEGVIADYETAKLLADCGAGDEPDAAILKRAQADLKAATKTKGDIAKIIAPLRTKVATMREQAEEAAEKRRRELVDEYGVLVREAESAAYDALKAAVPHLALYFHLNSRNPNENLPKVNVASQNRPFTVLAKGMGVGMNALFPLTNNPQNLIPAGSEAFDRGMEDAAKVLEQIADLRKAVAPAQKDEPVPEAPQISPNYAGDLRQVAHLPQARVE
ncbi:MAG: hypothetical protein ACPGOY_13875 [Rhodospirillaceae bacterium]